MVCYRDYGTVIPVDSKCSLYIHRRKCLGTDNEIALNEGVVCLQFKYLRQLLPILRLTVYLSDFCINPSPVTVSITSDSSATESEIVNAIITEVNANHDILLGQTLVGSEALIQEG